MYTFLEFKLIWQSLYTQNRTMTAPIFLRFFKFLPEKKEFFNICIWCFFPFVPTLTPYSRSFSSLICIPLGVYRNGWHNHLNTKTVLVFESVLITYISKFPCTLLETGRFTYTFWMKWRKKQQHKFRKKNETDKLSAFVEWTLLLFYCFFVHCFGK